MLTWHTEEIPGGLLYYTIYYLVGDRTMAAILFLGPVLTFLFIVLLTKHKNPEGITRHSTMTCAVLQATAKSHTGQVLNLTIW